MTNFVDSRQCPNQHSGRWPEYVTEMLILLIHNNKVGHRINKWVAESTKWVTESTKWVTESTNGYGELYQGGGRGGGEGGKGCGRGGGWDGGNPRNLSGSSVGRQSRLLGGGPIMAINFFHLPLQSTIIIILPILIIGILAIIIVIWYICSAATSGKICLQWTEFKESVDTASGNFREDNALSDVTLACEDGFQIEAHKVILAASSSFLQSLLLRIQNPHPMMS